MTLESRELPEISKSNSKFARMLPRAKYVARPSVYTQRSSRRNFSTIVLSIATRTHQDTDEQHLTAGIGPVYRRRG